MYIQGLNSHSSLVLLVLKIGKKGPPLEYSQLHGDQPDTLKRVNGGVKL